MPGLKAHLKRVEAKQRELADIRQSGRGKLFVVAGGTCSWIEVPAPEPGEHRVDDLYVSGDPIWHPNYCMVEGITVRRNTADVNDYGRVYDSRGKEWPDDQPPAGLPILAILANGGKIDFEAVKFWPGTLVSPHRLALRVTANASK